MSVDFRKLTTELRTLIAALETRCTDAEARESELRRQVTEMQARNHTLEDALKDATAKYKSLQAGLMMAPQPAEATDGTWNRSAVKEQRDRYLAMVRVIDDCITKLEKRG